MYSLSQGILETFQYFEFINFLKAVWLLRVVENNGNWTPRSAMEEDAWNRGLNPLNHYYYDRMNTVDTWARWGFPDMPFDRSELHARVVNSFLWLVNG